MMSQFTRGKSKSGVLNSTVASMTSNPVQSPYAPGMKRNPAGGYVWEMTPANQFAQFLRLGTHNSFYTTAEEMTADRLNFALDYMNTEPFDALAEIALVDLQGSIMPNTLLLTLAYLNTTSDPSVNHVAANLVGSVVRTGYQAEMYLSFLDQMRKLRQSKGEKVGMGRTKTRGLRLWLERLTDRELVLQRIKYNQREGTSIQDVVNFAHPRPGKAAKRRAIMAWLMNSLKEADEGILTQLAREGDKDALQIAAWKSISNPDVTPDFVATLVKATGLPREAVPTQHLQHSEVWAALLPMPAHATIRNLSNLEKRGLVDDAENWAVIQESLSTDRLLKSRVLPVHLLKAWVMVKNDKVRDLLSRQFFALLTQGDALSNATALIAVDVSGSMSKSAFEMPISCRDLAEVMALAYAKTFSVAQIVGFDDYLYEPYSGGLITKLGDPLFEKAGNGTNASIVFEWLERNSEYQPDVVIYLTDENTWMGGHVSQLMEKYRERVGKPVLLVTNSLEGHGLSLAQTDHPLTFDTHGFDASAIEAVHAKLALVRGTEGLTATP